MKLSRSTLILTLSLLGNAALLAVYLLRPDTFQTASGQTKASTALASDPIIPNTPTGHLSAGASNGTPAATLWSRLFSADPELLVKQLRAAGFPKSSIRLIVREILRPERDAKYYALYSQQTSSDYWKPQFNFGPTNPSLMAKHNELYKEERKLDRRLFGSNFDMDDLEAPPALRRMFGNLPNAKLQQLLTINSDYQEMQLDILEAPGSRKTGELTAEAREKIALLEKEQLRDIQQALSPEEFAEYELRASSTANALRLRMSLFQPTEEEYKKIFALQHAMDARFTGQAQTDEARAAYLAAQKETDKQIEAALGAERYADYIEARDNGTNNLNRLLARLELPLRTSATIKTIRTDITDRAAAIKANTQLSAEEQTAQLSALADEAQTKITTTLGGTRGYEAYDDLKGEWIRALRPKAATSRN